MYFEHITSKNSQNFLVSVFFPLIRFTFASVKNLLFVLLGCWLSASLWSQESTIRIKGKVFEERGQPVPNCIILNVRTQQGIFGLPDGSFVMECLPSDTLTITCLGYHARQLCFKDSIQKTVYYPRIFLNERTYSFSTLNVFAPRDLDDIQKDIQSLGFDESDYQLSGINAAVSPITFLYLQLSKKEQSRRVVAEMKNDDRRRDLLKELFRIYVDYKIIDLSNEEFDDFITYLNVSDEFLQTSSQYDFLIFVKDRFLDYQVARRNSRKLNTDDFNYDKD